MVCFHKVWQATPEFVAELHTRVQSGIAWLDKNQPGWAQKIDLSTMRLQDGCRCVLGQCFKDEATSGYVWALDHHPALGRYGVLHGFALGYSEADAPDGNYDLGWSVLGDIWYREIALRQRSSDVLVLRRDAKGRFIKA